MLIAVSCNKDQKIVKKLDGSWKATSFKISEAGFEIDLVALGGSASMNFEGCKLKKDDWCNVTTTTSILGSTDVDNSIYRVTGDGTKLETKDSYTSSYVRVINIIELTKTVCKLTQTEDGKTTTIELKKN